MQRSYDYVDPGRSLNLGCSRVASRQWKRDVQWHSQIAAWVL